MIKAVVFDCFGVLYPVVSDVYYERHIADFNYDTNLLNELNTKIDLGLINGQEFFKGIEDATGIPANQAAKEFNEIKVLDEGMIDLVKSLKSKYQVALLSNAGEGELDCLKRDNISGLFETITASYEVGVVKPDKKIFMLCAKSLKCNPADCLFIDDGIKNVEGAKQAGMSSIQFKNTEQLKADLKQILGNWGEL